MNKSSFTLHVRGSDVHTYRNHCVRPKAKKL